MKLFKFRNRAKTYKCTRCKKNISEENFCWIGNHRFCIECANPKSILLPKAPIIKKEDVETQKTLSYTCARCKKQIIHDEVEWIGSHKFCKACATPKNIFNIKNPMSTDKKEKCAIPMVQRCSRCNDTFTLVNSNVNPRRVLCSDCTYTIANLGEKNKKASCTRCKKSISYKMMQLKDNKYFCFDCTKSSLDSLPEFLLLRTPQLESDSIYRLKTCSCANCDREIDKLTFSYWFSNQRLCYTCAKKRLDKLESSTAKPSQNTADTKNIPKFSYPVFDLNKEEEFWISEIEKTHKETINGKLKLSDVFMFVDKFMIREVPDRIDDMDTDSININVYSNAERSVWCFMLVNDYISGWDGWPVYYGGFITPEKFMEYMHKLGNHYYDNLID